MMVGGRVVPYIQTVLLLLIRGSLQGLGTEYLRSDLVARIRRRPRAKSTFPVQVCLRCGHDLPSTFAEPQFHLPVRVRTPTFQNYLVSIL